MANTCLPHDGLGRFERLGEGLGGRALPADSRLTLLPGKHYIV